MISEQIAVQCMLFLSGAALGCGILAAYDMVRIWRRIVKHGTVWIAAEDMIFWCICGVICFGMLFRQNSGIVRGFIIFALICGMGIYYFLFSRTVVRVGTALMQAIVHVIGIIFRPVAVPLKLLGKKTGKILKKQLKKLWKKIRMNLCKL